MNTLVTLIKNIRPYRSIHYSGLVVGGSLIGYWLLGNNTGYFNMYGIPSGILAIAIILAFQTACVINDFHDLKGDIITNPERPLVKDKIAPKIYKRWGLNRNSTNF